MNVKIKNDIKIKMLKECGLSEDDVHAGCRKVKFHVEEFDVFELIKLSFSGIYCDAMWIESEEYFLSKSLMTFKEWLVKKYINKGKYKITEYGIVEFS